MRSRRSPDASHDLFAAAHESVPDSFHVKAHKSANGRGSAATWYPCLFFLRIQSASLGANKLTAQVLETQPARRMSGARGPPCR